MKTLIVHPEDRSTDFLKPIYENVSDATIIHGGVSKTQIKQLINEHDRIYMMGHGSPSGLFSCAKFGDNDYSGFIIDHTMVEVLSSKECIAIWCNADKFMNQHELNGFYSGMFISEVGEAKYCGLPDTVLETVTVSNNYFAQIAGEVINEPLSVIYEHVMDNYGLLLGLNSVASYNYDRLYLAE